MQIKAIVEREREREREGGGGGWVNDAGLGKGERERVCLVNKSHEKMGEDSPTSGQINHHLKADTGRQVFILFVL